MFQSVWVALNMNHVAFLSLLQTEKTKSAARLAQTELTPLSLRPDEFLHCGSTLLHKVLHKSEPVGSTELKRVEREIESRGAREGCVARDAKCCKFFGSCEPCASSLLACSSEQSLFLKFTSQNRSRIKNRSRNRNSRLKKSS